MRLERIIQATIFEVFARHKIGCALKAMPLWLDGQRALLSLVASDLRGLRETGNQGLPAEAVLSCPRLKQDRQLSYEELAFHLEDSASFRAFARLPLPWSPKKYASHAVLLRRSPRSRCPSSDTPAPPQSIDCYSEPGSLTWGSCALRCAGPTPSTLWPY